MNEMNIQMLSGSLYAQIFGRSRPKPTATDSQPLRQDLARHGIDASKPALLPDVELKLPPLRGTDIEEHFRAIAHEQSEPYRRAVEGLPEAVPPVPSAWSRHAGWTRYDPVTGAATPIAYPPDVALVFDVEVCVREGPLPVLATATGTAGCWYSWVSPVLAPSAEPNDPPAHYTLPDLIPLEGADAVDAREARVVIGHNVSYDRARVREQYWVQPTGLRFLDTMSLHVCVSGVTSYQRAMLKSARQLPAEDVGWSEQSALNNLADVYALYCGREGVPAKAKRDTFVEGTLQDVRDDFQALVGYCAQDVRATAQILRRLWPLFTERFPHPATLAGMLEMGSAYLPVNANWTRYLTEADLAHEDLDLEARHLLAQRADAACALLHGGAYRRDLWLWDQDWSVQELKLKASKPAKATREPAREEARGKFDYLYELGGRLPVRRPLLPGYPAWYRALCAKPTADCDWRPGPELGTGMQIAPKLLSLRWEGFPLHYIRGHGWGFLVPFRYTQPDGGVLPLEQLIASCPVIQPAPATAGGDGPGADALHALAVDVERTIARKEYYQRRGKRPTPAAPTGYGGAGVWCDVELEGCCYFLQLPHKDGAGHRVGNPLSKDFLAKFSENVLTGDGRAAQRVVEIARSLSYWRNNRDRIRGQLVVWTPGPDGAPTVGAIVPQVVVCGTLTRRAMEPTWMTAANAQRERIGSELRAMVQAPPGYRLVGADVDSQELWIASVLGDAGTGLHGGTPFGWMTLSGTKAARTDMHSVTAQAVGISRDHAKILNYARIYGAGQPFAERLLKQFNPALTAAEARSKAAKMFTLTKGRKTYRLREALRPDYPTQPARSSAYEALGLARVCNRAVGELFDGPHWHGGTESAMFNRLEAIAGAARPATPFLGGRLSRALEPQPGTEERFLPTRINWVVQSGAVDFLHLMLVCMRWLMGGASARLRFCLSFHDEVRYLVPDRYAHHAALALHATNLLTRAFCAHRVGFRDLPQSVAFFSSVEVDRVLRKEAQHDCRTPSNPHGLRDGYGIPDGESLDIYQTLARLDPAQRDMSGWEWHRPPTDRSKPPKRTPFPAPESIAARAVQLAVMFRTLPRLLLSSGLWTQLVLLCPGNGAGSDRADTLLTLPERRAYSFQLDDQPRIGAIFATINHIDVVNGVTDALADEPDRAWLEQLLQRRTVRWYDAAPSALCSLADSDDAHDTESAGDETDCYTLDRHTDRLARLQLHWDENRTGGYIIYGNLTELPRYACLFDPTGTYLLLADAVDTESPFVRTWLAQLLRRIWYRRGVYRVFVRLRDALYGYDPFRHAGTGEYGALVELAHGEPPPIVPPADFAGYPVRIEVFRSVYSNPVEGGSKAAPVEYTGADVTARDVFCQALNATVIHVPADRDLFGDRQPNGSFTGALGRLTRREVDIVFTGFFVKEYYTREVDFTAGLYSDAVCCLVRKARRIPEALLPLYIFPGDIWALLGLLGLLCACVWCALRWCVAGRVRGAGRLWSRRHRLAVLFNLPRRLRHAGPPRLLAQLYVDAFVLLVSAPYQRFTRSGVERLFLTGLLLVSLIFVSLYQSGLAAVFVNPLYYPDVGTLQQLAATGMEIPVKYRGFIDDVFAVNYSRLMDTLRGRMRHLPVKESMLARVARLGNVATVTRRTTLALDNAVYMATRQLHMVPECPRTYTLAYVTPRRSALGERFNKVLLRMVGGGLLDHWIDETRYGWTLRNRRVVQSMLESNFKVLTVLDMQFAFYMLAIGLTLSVAAIGVELVRFRRTHTAGETQRQAARHDALPS
uniref:DNA polymerase subunit gamma-1 n=1 Tax=Anopheles dirus TaxID=7168 RepID=A0A182N1E0_9DIPT